MSVLDLSLLGWLVSLVVGFVFGGVFFLSMKVQVDYVVNKKGPLWVVPAALYVRMAMLAALLVVVALSMADCKEKIPAAMISGTVGAMIARVLVGRMVKKSTSEQQEDKTGA